MSARTVVLASLCLAHALGMGVRLRSGANPIRKVVTLMQDMQKELEAEKEADKTIFEKFMCICTEYPAELQDTVAEASKVADEMASDLESEGAEKARLLEELKGHVTEKAEAETDLNKASALRSKEKAEYEEETANLKASIDGLAKAIPALEKGAGAAFLQSKAVPTLEAVVKSATTLSSWQKKTVTAFLTGGASEGDSGEVVGILKQMAEDMAKNLANTDKEDQVSADGFGQLKSAKDDELAAVSQAIESKEKQSGALAVSIAQNKDSLEDANGRKASAQKMLATLARDCSAQKAEWEAHFKLKGEEITAISETIVILNDDDALDIFKKAVPSALAQDAGQGLLQVTHQAAFQALEDLRLRVRRGRQLVHKASLEALQLQGRGQASTRNETSSDLEKIPEDMIKNLEKEGEDDLKKKEFCLSEIKKAEVAEKKSQDALDAIDAEVAKVADEHADVDEEVAAVQKEIHEIDRSVAEATELRKKEHAEYGESLSMADAAVALLAKAKNRLQKFYNPTLYKASPVKEMTMEEKIIAGSFVQRLARRARQMPELPGIPKREGKNSGGVLALLDQLSNELVMGKTESEHDEKSAQKDYVELMQESGESREGMQKSIVEKQESKALLDERLIEAKEGKKQTFLELTNAHEMTSSVHTTCDFLLDHFEDREAARKSEIEKLESAKEMLKASQK